MWSVVDGKVLMAFEYMPRGTLTESIYDSSVKIAPAFVRSVSSAMFNGLSFLHENDIIHCDIKASGAPHRLLNVRRCLRRAAA
jgi:serine/threonine protein kinase